MDTYGQKLQRVTEELRKARSESKTDTFVVSGLRILGDEAKELQKWMPHVLKGFLADFWSSNRKDLKYAILVQTWEKSNQVSRWILKSKLKAFDQSECEKNIDEWIDLFKLSSRSATGLTGSLHFIQAHLPQRIKFLFDKFGLGYGVMTTQGSEHLNRVLKNNLGSHSNHTPENFKHIVTRIAMGGYYCFDIILEEEKAEREKLNAPKRSYPDRRKALAENEGLEDPTAAFPDDLLGARSE
eukprot:TRINITY_DN20757_c0_g1_i1.p1 TRINITY_DN20757_c0_g1~~TRINITY_DN20757_c0_g1_i1.p1  ORF type:complete len:260 (+),score=29.55 TRINITY_DN20757_c0_g1_i1:58-780(+)